MVSSRLTIWGNQHLRRDICLLLVVCCCALVVPIPWSRPVASPTGKDRSIPFACQDRPCGCRSAAQCAEQCCCFTPTQKAAWARSVGLSIPLEVVDVVPEQMPDNVVSSIAQDQPAEQPCQSQSTALTACCASQSGESNNPVADLKRATSSNVSVEAPPRQVQPALLGWVALKCQGRAWDWLAVAWTGLLPQSELLLGNQTKGALCPIPRADGWPDCSFRPPVPPPRIASGPHLLLDGSMKLALARDAEC